MLFFGCGRTVVGVAYHLTVGYLSSIADALDAILQPGVDGLLWAKARAHGKTPDGRLRSGRSSLHSDRAAVHLCSLV